MYIMNSIQKLIKRVMMLFVCCLILAGCNDNPVAVNGKKADMSGYGDLKITDHHYIEETMKGLLEKAEEKKDGIYYMGYLNCPWCQDIVPVLEQAAKETGNYIYYIDIKDEKNTPYKDKLKDWASDNLLEDEYGVKMLYVPYVIVMKKGKITSSHIGTFDTHDATQRDMNEEEKEQLLKIYKDMME